MKNIVCLMMPFFLSICLVGCNKNPSDHNGPTTCLEFQIALREEGVTEEPEANTGTFHVVSHHKIPVHIGMESEKVISIANNIWVDIRWSKSEMRGDWLWLHDLEYRIRNKMFYNGTGGDMDWTPAGGQGLSSAWKHLNTRVGYLGTPQGPGPILYHRIRWLNPSPVIPDIEMSEFVQNLESES